MHGLSCEGCSNKSVSYRLCQVLYLGTLFACVARRCSINLGRLLSFWHDGIFWQILSSRTVKRVEHTRTFCGRNHNIGGRRLGGTGSANDDAQALLAKHRAFVGWQLEDGTFKTLRLEREYVNDKGKVTEQ